MMINFLSKNRNLVLVCGVLSFLYVLPIILANIYYTDDMGRIISGYGWDHDGRFIASILSNIFSFNSTITSIYPYSIIFSGLIVFFAGLVIVYVFFESDFRYHSNLLPLILLISPFFLENLAYRYDSLYMSLSILFAVLPLLLWNKKEFFFISIGSLFLVFGLYQTSAMLYIACVLCLQIKILLQTEGRLVVKNITYALISFLVAFFLYKKALDLLAYNISRSEFLPLSKESVQVVYQRLKDYREVFKTLFIDSNYIYAVMPLAACSVIGFVASVIAMPSVKEKLYKGMIILLLIGGVFLSFLLPNIILKTMWLTARTMIIFPTLLVLCVIFVNNLLYYHSTSKIIRYFITVSYIVLFGYSFMLSSVFGSILKSNDEYQKFLANNITMSILAEQEKLNENEQLGLIIVGKGPQAPTSKSLYKEYPIMNILAPNYLSEGWWWGLRNQSYYYEFVWPSNKEQLIDRKCEMDIIDSSLLYDIRREGLNYIIDFRKGC